MFGPEIQGTISAKVVFTSGLFLLKILINVHLCYLQQVTHQRLDEVHCKTFHSNRRKSSAPRQQGHLTVHRQRTVLNFSFLQYESYATYFMKYILYCMGTSFKKNEKSCEEVFKSEILTKKFTFDGRKYSASI